MPIAETIQRASLLGKLKKNAGRRNEAALEFEESRRELKTLLEAGRTKHVPVTKMCEAAGINRERAYELLRRDDVPRPREAYNTEGGN